MKTITGVISNNSIEWLNEEIDGGINLDYESHVKGCPNEEHDTCWESQPSDTILIGDWKQDKNGLYEPNKRGKNGYAAIVNETETQVVWSKTRAYVRAMCSPCFPGQADLDSGKGKIKAWTLPADMIGND